MDKDEREIAYWIFEEASFGSETYHCSECGQVLTVCHGERMNYCPNCGRKMKYYEN